MENNKFDWGAFYSSVLASVYPVFLGITLAHFIQLNSTEEGTSPTFQFFEFGTAREIIIFFSLIGYYLFDWLTALERVRKFDSRKHMLTVVLFIIANIVFCFLIVYSTQDEILAFAFMGAYMFCAACFDFIANLRLSSPIVKYTASTRLTFGILLMVGGALVKYAGDAEKISSHRELILWICCGMVSIITFLKLIRLRCGDGTE